MSSSTSIRADPDRPPCDATRFIDWLTRPTTSRTNFRSLRWSCSIQADAASAAHGSQIGGVRTHLNVGSGEAERHFSIATRDDGAVFDNLLGSSASVKAPRSTPERRRRHRQTSSSTGFFSTHIG